MTGVHARLDLQGLRASYREAGFVSIPDFLDEAEMATLRAEMQRVIDEVVSRMPASEVYREHRDDDASLKQLQRLHVHDASLAPYLASGPFADLAEILLGERPAPQNLQYFDKAPGNNRPTPPHQDGAYFPIEPMRAVTIWLALDDVAVEQGCVRYVRGSHRRGLRRHERGGTLGFSREIVDYGPEDAVREECFPCRAGHVIAHDARTIHRADGNSSRDRHRRALGFIYYAASCTVDQQAREQYQRRLDADLIARGRLREVGEQS